MQNNPADIIVELESDNSRLFKESVIAREMQADNVEFFEGLKFACNKLVTFGVNEKSIPSKNKNTEINGYLYAYFLSIHM